MCDSLLNWLENPDAAQDDGRGGQCRVGRSDKKSAVQRGEPATPHRAVPHYLTELALTFAKSRLPKPVS